MPLLLLQISILVVYTEMITVLFSKICALKPVFKDLLFYTPKMPLLCKGMAKTCKKFSVIS